MKKNKLDIIFLLDRSGSMSGSENNTINSYNSYLSKQKKNKYLTKITTILFDDQYEILFNRENIKEVKYLTNKEYYVRGCTALYDAIGKTINFYSRQIKNKVLFIIITDGLENASREFDKLRIKQLIQNHPNWEFIYLGANIDTYSEATKIGIKESNIASYQKTKKGFNDLFEAVDEATISLLKHDNLSNKWNQRLND
ncbi:MAG TPA: VWA domain-containing protein [Candidatus Coprovivens excrementavium]|nr:VWA domain-containing protein [Candidatus Coprovivens excrementavium]